MCPLWPLHYIILYLLLFLSAHYIVMAVSKNVSVSNRSNNIILEPVEIQQLHMRETKTVNVTILSSVLNGYEGGEIRIVPEVGNIVQCSPEFFRISPSTENDVVQFSITGEFMGKTDIQVHFNRIGLRNSDTVSYLLPVTVIREERLIDHLFTTSVIVLVSVLFVNFGCALDWNVVLESFKKPVTLIIGMVPQFIFMPLISYATGSLLFTESVAMQLGLFFTGISPSGGASNVWVCFLGGSLSLSITITAIGNFFAFLTMPAWTFSLGRLIFNNANLVVPYAKVIKFASSLLPPLLLGLLLQKKCPKVSQKLLPFLKPLSSFLILFIVVFATITNLYLFKLFTWKILLAGLCVPLFGFVSGWIICYMFNRTYTDTLAIAVETSVQNTGIAIFMLRLSLAQPEADLTTVIPVAVAVMTPVPLLVWYICQKIITHMKGIIEVKSKPCLVFSDERSASSLIDHNQMSPVVDFLGPNL